MAPNQLVDQRYYQVASPGSISERVVVAARDGIYRDFLRLTRPAVDDRILDVGVSDVVGIAANLIERKYPNLDRVTAVGLGAAHEFQAEFPDVTYRQIQAGGSLPFGDGQFDIATSNAVLEHVGSHMAQQQFVAELARVGRTVFITVPHRFFPVEHHTGIPVLHWTDSSFAVACRLLSKQEWTEAANLILMTRRRLHELTLGLPAAKPFRIGTTGIRLGPFSSNLFLLIGGPDAI